MPGKYRGRCLPLNANWQINCFIQALLQVLLTLQALQRDLPVPHPQTDRGGCRSSLGLQLLTPGLFILVPCTQKERPWTLKDCILRRRRHRKYLSSPQTESNLHSILWSPCFTRSTATLQEEEEQPHDLKARVWRTLQEEEPTALTAPRVILLFHPFCLSSLPPETEG